MAAIEAFWLAGWDTAPAPAIPLSVQQAAKAGGRTGRAVRTEPQPAPPIVLTCTPAIAAPVLLAPAVRLRVWSDDDDLTVLLLA